MPRPRDDRRQVEAGSAHMFSTPWPTPLAEARPPAAAARTTARGGDEVFGDVGVAEVDQAERGEGAEERRYEEAAEDAEARRPVGTAAVAVRA